MMKFADVNGERREAQPGLQGMCPWCSRPMVAKCGEVKIWHWAHQGRRVCDSWWENETEWHRAWKEEFPVNWQEVIHQAENGEKHIADVKTDQGWVIEFQHSHIKPEERRSRDEFYSKLVWVVDGTRLKRDRVQFHNAWNYGRHVGGNSRIRKIFTDECALLRKWGNSMVPIFFDFGDDQNFWWLHAKGSSEQVYVAQYSRTDFIKIHRNGDTGHAHSFPSRMGSEFVCQSRPGGGWAGSLFQPLPNPFCPR